MTKDEIAKVMEITRELVEKMMKEIEGDVEQLRCSYRLKHDNMMADLSIKGTIEDFVEIIKIQKISDEVDKALRQAIRLIQRTE